MTSRERVLAALSHQPTDRVPVDLGSSNVTSIHLATYQRLLAYFNLTDPQIRMMDHATQLVVPCERLLEVLDIDTRGVQLSAPEGAIPPDPSQSRYLDCWGVEWFRPEGATCFDVISSPLQNMEELDEVMDYTFPTLGQLASANGLAERLSRFNDKRYAIVGSFGSSIFMKALQIRGYSTFLEDLIINPDIADYLMERILQIRIGLVDMLMDACADALDVIEMADDVAGQSSLMMSVHHYREHIKPYTKRLIEHIRKRSNARILYHSCGSIFPLIDDLLDVGIDILNPVQVSAKDMGRIDLLRDRFGDRLCFWGGIDSQRLLPNASEGEVARQVSRTLDVFRDCGGYVMCASHNLQSDIPVPNILAMYRRETKG